MVGQLGFGWDGFATARRGVPATERLMMSGFGQLRSGSFG